MVTKIKDECDMLSFDDFYGSEWQFDVTYRNPALCTWAYLKRIDLSHENEPK